VTRACTSCFVLALTCSGRVLQRAAAAALRGSSELETEFEIVRKAAKFLGEDEPAPKGSTR
jgi:hypothetical protein